MSRVFWEIADYRGVREPEIVAVGREELLVSIIKYVDINDKESGKNVIHYLIYVYCMAITGLENY